MSVRGLFFIRLVSAIAITLLVCSVAYVAVGWGIQSGRLMWMQKLLGETRFWRLYASYEKAAATLLSSDRDGDGVCDGLEIFNGTDPRDPLSHPKFDATFERGDICVYVEGGRFVNSGQVDTADLQNMLLPHTGEQFHVRGYIYLSFGGNPPARGFRLRATFPTLTPAGRSPAAEPLLIPVASDGSFAFDWQVPVEIAVDPKSEPTVAFANAVTGETLFQWKVHFVSARPPLPITVLQSKDMDNPSRCTHLLKWEPAPSATYALLVEMAQDRNGAQWFPLFVVPATSDHLIVKQELEFYHGPLKFRVSPVSFQPPLSSP